MAIAGAILLSGYCEQIDTSRDLTSLKAGDRILIGGAANNPAPRQKAALPTTFDICEGREETPDGVDRFAVQQDCDAGVDVPVAPIFDYDFMPVKATVTDVRWRSPEDLNIYKADLLPGQELIPKFWITFTRDDINGVRPGDDPLCATRPVSFAGDGDGALSASPRIRILRSN